MMRENGQKNGEREWDRKMVRVDRKVQNGENGKEWTEMSRMVRMGKSPHNVQNEKTPPGVRNVQNEKMSTPPGVRNGEKW
jgi:hypothetical protein